MQQHGHLGFGHPPQHLQQNGVQERDFWFDHQGQQEVQLEPMQYDAHAEMLHQQALFPAPPQWHAYNAPPERHQQQQWSPWEGNVNRQPAPIDALLDASEGGHVEYHDAAAQENGAWLTAHEVRHVDHHDTAVQGTGLFQNHELEHEGILSNGPDRFHLASRAPIGLDPNEVLGMDGQQDDFFEALDPAHRHVANPQNQGFEAMDLGQNGPDQVDQASEHSGSSNDDTSTAIDEDDKENDEWDGTFRDNADDDDEDIYEDDVEPINID